MKAVPIEKRRDRRRNDVQSGASDRIDVKLVADNNQNLNQEKDLRAVRYLRRARRLADILSKGYDDALAAAQRAIELEPDLAEAYLVCGEVLFALDRFEEALTVLNRAVELAPSDKAYAQRGEVLTYLRRFDEAEADCNQAIKLGHGSVWADSARFTLLRIRPEIKKRNDRAFLEYIEGGDFGKEVEHNNKNNTMDETAEFCATAAKEGFTVAEFRRIIDNAKQAAKGEVTKRDTTGRATAEPRLKAAKGAAGKTSARASAAPRRDDAATVRALAGLEHLQKEFSALSDKPEVERARIARQFVSAFERAQRRGVDVDAEIVREARRFLTGYNRRQRALKRAASPAV
jgi:tetratricopeptide (TPR) repeat protein